MIPVTPSPLNSLGGRTEENPAPEVSPGFFVRYTGPNRLVKNWSHANPPVNPSVTTCEEALPTFKCAQARFGLRRKKSPVREVLVRFPGLS